MRGPWSRGAVTGVGSLPGTDNADAIRMVLGEHPLLPYLPELPARGPGADMIGRTAALLVDLAVEIVPSGWRLTARPGRELRRARDLLEADLDALQAAAGDHLGPLKVQLAGPWTLAAGVEVPAGHRVLTDPGAVRDLADSLAEGVRHHLDQLQQRLPHATIVGQLDEPGLPAVLAGAVPTASGYGTVRAVDPIRARDILTPVLAALPAGARIVHCCAEGAPVALLREAGATGLGLDLGQISHATTDSIGEAVDAGAALLLGVVPSQSLTDLAFEPVRDRLLAWWRQLGFSDNLLGEVVVPTPTCGLAGATPHYARQVMGVLAQVGRAIAEL